MNMELWQQILLSEEAVRLSAKKEQSAVQPPRQNAPPVLEEGANIRYRTVIAYDSGNNAEYIGEANTGTSAQSDAWRIRRLTYDGRGNITNIKWAGSNQKFDKIWNDRETYVYS